MCTRSVKLSQVFLCMIEVKEGDAEEEVEPLLVKVRWHGVKREERVCCKECDSGESLKICAFRCCSALHWIITGSRFWKQEKTIQERAMEREPSWC